MDRTCRRKPCVPRESREIWILEDGIGQDGTRVSSDPIRSDPTRGLKSVFTFVYTRDSDVRQGRHMGVDTGHTV